MTKWIGVEGEKDERETLLSAGQYLPRCTEKKLAAPVLQEHQDLLDFSATII